MKTRDNYTVELENFEGPLQFLLHLVQKQEIDIHDIRLKQITDQFLRDFENPDVDLGAEFIGTAAALIWMKSKMLLPKDQQENEDSDDECGPDPHFEVIHQLIDYCRFKEAGKTLAKMEVENSAYYPRGVSGDYEAKKPLGIEHLSLDDLALFFKDVIAKAELNKGKVQEETFRVSDKIRFLRQRLRQGEPILFGDIFRIDMCKEELIVTFLAVLELMKIGEAAVGRDTNTEQIVIFPGDE
ncbi:MAG: segregation/condensation protein A [Chlamydiales bacterium]|nr:segregation/condensation protein A [Chlamydiia bacterium]MCP5507783.1 segregation/condensation protein A [Chlamydiales bacterium]